MRLGMTTRLRTGHPESSLLTTSWCVPHPGWHIDEQTAPGDPGTNHCDGGGSQAEGGQEAALLTIDPINFRLMFAIIFACGRCAHLSTKSTFDRPSRRVADVPAVEKLSPQFIDHPIN